MRADVHPRTSQERSSSRRGDRSAPPELSHSTAPALKLRYATSNFQPRLSWPTMVSRRADRGVENVCRMGGAGFQGAQTILMSSLLDTHRAIFFPPICIIEPPQLTEHTLWPLAQRAKGINPHTYDRQPLIRVSQHSAYFCSSCVPSSSPWDLATSEDLRLIVDKIVLACYARS